MRQKIQKLVNSGAITEGMVEFEALKVQENEDKLEQEQAYATLQMQLMSQSEVQYVLELFQIGGENILDEDKLKSYFKKAKTTLELLYAKLGIELIFKHINTSYIQMSKTDLKDTLIKLLYRCLNEFNMVEQVKRIFDIKASKESFYRDVLKNIESTDSDLPFEQYGQSRLSNLQRLVVVYALNISKLYI